MLKVFRPTDYMYFEDFKYSDEANKVLAHPLYDEDIEKWILEGYTRVYLYQTNGSDFNLILINPDEKKGAYHKGIYFKTIGAFAITRKHILESHLDMITEIIKGM